MNDPDAIECGECGAEIGHDEYLFFVRLGFNCHGLKMVNDDRDEMVVCARCAPKSIVPVGHRAPGSDALAWCDSCDWTIDRREGGHVANSDVIIENAAMHAAVCSRDGKTYVLPEVRQ